MREQALVSSLATRLIFVELALGRMAIFTRRSRASTIQMVSARLSKNDTRITFALDTSFPRHTSTSCQCGGIWIRFLLGTIVCTGSPSNTGLFLSTDNKYLFLLQHHLIHFDCLPLLLIQFSRAWRQSFVIEGSDLYSSSPLSSIFDSWEPISSDESPCRTIPMQFRVA